ncbi:MAG: hypothetical protein PF483_10000 [Halothiobacillus sp.]|jgi:hypothetical protein|nr:hypothetical protein [Halothiobacillus sp.]
MTTLICNRDAGNNQDILTDEHAACSYGRPVLVHQGQALGVADMYDEGLFGARPAREITIATQGLLTDDELALLNKWREDCAR